MKNREIKFDVLHENKPFGIERLNNGRWEWMCFELNPDTGEIWNHGVFKNNANLTRRQFTGLKDKNGKDAYQGDFAIINNELCIVNFDTHFICGWEFKSTKSGCYTFNSICTNFNNKGCQDFEIIGNIYENHNLLQQ
ncbi:MAG: YopX family protein [Bacteroidota bacterium]